MPDQYYALRRIVGAMQPEQIHLAYWGSPDKMAVSFASGTAAVVEGVPEPKAAQEKTAYVQWGAAPDALTSNATCVTGAYTQNQYAIKKSAGYVSPYLSHCLMTGARPAGVGGRALARLLPAAPVLAHAPLAPRAGLCTLTLTGAAWQGRRLGGA